MGPGPPFPGRALSTAFLLGSLAPAQMGPTPDRYPPAARPGLLKGTTIRVWADDDGKITDPPLRSSQIRSRTMGAAAVGALAVHATAAAAYVGGIVGPVERYCDVVQRGAVSAQALSHAARLRRWMTRLATP